MPGTPFTPHPPPAPAPRPEFAGVDHGPQDPNFVPTFDTVEISDGVRKYVAIKENFASEECARELAIMFGAIAVDERPYLSGNTGNVSVSKKQRFLVFLDPAGLRPFWVCAGWIANYYLRNPLSKHPTGARDAALRYIEEQRRLNGGGR